MKLKLRNILLSLTWLFSTNAALAELDEWTNHMCAADAAHVKGNYQQAEKLYATAVTEAEKFGIQDHRLSISLNNLAQMYSEQKKYSEAEPLFERSLLVTEKVFGPNDAALIPSLNNLAKMYKAQGQYAKSETLYKRVLALRVKLLGANHPDVAASLNNYAILLDRTNRKAEAKKLRARAKAIMAKQPKGEE